MWLASVDSPAADEERTLARLRTLWSDLIAPTVALHNGRVFKRRGDGSIVEFRSVVDAVRCAIEVQNGMVERNAGLLQGIPGPRWQPNTDYRSPERPIFPTVIGFIRLLARRELGASMASLCPKTLRSSD
jgi:hypothetical protein